ncbi:MAG TPA: YggS family pyridoxal phosphate-dependent enzyme [Anaerolineaceae bacterium]
MDEALVSAIRERYQRVQGQIADATTRSGREAGAVCLVVVSKSQPLEVVRAAIAAGASRMGENYVEEAVAKMAALPETAVEWHMIGHVQSRKADLVAGHFYMLHSLDSVKLAERLDRFCDKSGRSLPVLLEVNVSGEESKFGFPAWEEHHWPDLEPPFEQIMALPRLRISGLMSMPPFFDDPERTRPFFQRLRRLQLFLRQCLPQADWTELSMGTSADFIAAIEEGATYVRVGQAILGPRPA